MQHWLISTVAGVLLGILLYYCVLLRMHVGPIIKERYGNWARRVYWGFTIAIMVVIANLVLIGLQAYLDGETVVDSRRIMEMWFALLGLVVALMLVKRKLSRER